MVSPATCRRTFTRHRCMLCWFPGRTSCSRRLCLRCPNGWRRWHRLLANGSRPGWPRIIPRFRSSAVGCPQSPGRQNLVPWYVARTVKAILGSRCFQAILLSLKRWLADRSAAHPPTTAVQPLSFGAGLHAGRGGAVAVRPALTKGHSGGGRTTVHGCSARVQATRPDPGRQRARTLQRGTAISAGGRRQRGCRLPPHLGLVQLS